MHICDLRLSPATVAVIVAYFLDCTHSLAHSTARRDSVSLHSNFGPLPCNQRKAEKK
ncbi:hypothetical protein IMY05_001G0174300 [Salix suchowensis]|nr:hypothetical protein IMY05_001G0174300 [Salix suchowensis]